jgi:asparagine synthase (glutamine-hydrolysing)
VGAPGDPADESADSRETARLLGIPHEVVELSPNEASSMDDLLEEVVAAYGEPFGCSSAMGMLQVSRAVKPRATVLLTGDGGDDVFLGYPFHKHFWMAQRLAQHMPNAVSGLWRAARPAIAGIDSLRRARHFMDYATGGLGAVTRVHDGLPHYQRLGLLGERIAGCTIDQRRIPLSASPARHILSDVLAYEQRTRFVGEFMTKVDGGTMHYAIEARSPLLDQKLWEFAATLPFSVRLHQGRLKAILREIARRRIGPQVSSRRKRGFTIPVQRWLAGKWSGGFEEIFSGSLLEKEGWLRPGALRASAREATARGLAPNQLWYLLVLEQWMRSDSRPVLSLASEVTLR